MLDRLVKTWRPFLILVVALAVFLGAFFYYYRGAYQAPPNPELPLAKITLPSTSYARFDETPRSEKGLLLLDGFHRNDYHELEITNLLSKVAERGYEVDFMLGEPSRFTNFGTLDPELKPAVLEERLRGADSLVVVAAWEVYQKSEVDVIERFVRKGGKLLLVADPSRGNEMNSLSKRFGITFQPGYLYNLAEYDTNFQEIFVRSFRPSPVTRNLTEIALYTAGPIETSGTGLALTDSNTKSTLVEQNQAFHPLASGEDSNVLAVYDLTFMIPPQSSVKDNDRLVSNIADFLTTSDRRFDLADFPYFFKEDTDVLVGGPALLDLATELRSVLSSFRISSQMLGVEDLRKDTVFLGLFDDSSRVVQYLDLVGIQVGSTIRTPFTRDVEKEGTAVAVLHTMAERDVLIILGDSRETIAAVIERLRSGGFRRGLVSDFVGVYRQS